MPDLRDRFVGGLVGCAVGDALGAPFEGYWDHQIPDRDLCLTGFAAFEGYPPGQYTDDTQLTLATVRSIVRRGGVEPADIARSIAGLWKHDTVVGPGGSCTFAAHAYLRGRDWTACGAPAGQAGNGTAMRTAVIGLAFLDDPGRLAGAAADASRITHHDPRSIAGGVAIARAGHLLATEDPLDPHAFCDAIAATMEPYEPAFAALVADLPARLLEDRDDALRAIAWAGSAQPEFSRPIITPYVVPTVLAALWAVLRHPDSWPDGVAAAIRLGGDVDTLGAIVGALLGIRLGRPSIPGHLAEGVLDSARIHRLAHRYCLSMTGKTQ